MDSDSINQYTADINSLNYWGQACVSQKTRKLYEPEKQFVKLRPAYSIKLVFPYVVKAIKIKITAKYRDMEHLRFEDTKRIMSPEKFRDFRETAPRTGDVGLISFAGHMVFANE